MTGAVAWNPDTADEIVSVGDRVRGIFHVTAVVPLGKSFQTWIDSLDLDRIWNERMALEGHETRVETESARMVKLISSSDPAVLSDGTPVSLLRAEVEVIARVTVNGIAAWVVVSLLVAAIVGVATFPEETRAVLVAAFRIAGEATAAALVPLAALALIGLVAFAFLEGQ